MVDLNKLKDEVKNQLAISRQETASLERTLTVLNNMNPSAKTTNKKGHKMSAATRRKISLAMKKSHAARTAK